MVPESQAPDQGQSPTIGQLTLAQALWCWPLSATLQISTTPCQAPSHHVSLPFELVKEPRLPSPTISPITSFPV